MNLNYLTRRLGQAVITFWATVTLTFALYHMMPGGPVESMQNIILQQITTSGGTADLEQIEQMVTLYANIQPSDPVYIQYIDYWRQLLFEFSMGRSFSHQEPVTTLIAERIPWSMFVSVYSLVIGYTASILLGSAMAFKEKSRFDSIMSTIMVSLQSTPYYIVALLLIYTTALQLGWFPTGGRVGTGVEAGFNLEFMTSIVHHAALPILSTSILGISGAISLRGNAIRVLGEDYLRVAELRGLRPSRIATEYVGRNAILPMYTRFMIGIAGVLSSSVILEQIFSYPGMGLLMYNAISIRDYPLLMGTLIIFTSITIIGILIADLTYGYIDPRASGGGGTE